MIIIAKTQKILFVILAVAILAAITSAVWFGYGYFKSKNDLTEAKTYLEDLGKLTGVESYGTAHIHADLKVYVEGQQINLFEEKNIEKNRFVHFHPTINPQKPNEDVIHVHAAGITLKQFLNTLGIALTKDCLTLEGARYCESDDKTLKVYVNGTINPNHENYVINDLDKILVSFGDENKNEIENQLKSIGDNAKTHSTPLNFECRVDC